MRLCVYLCSEYPHQNEYEPGHEKMCLILYANNKGADLIGVCGMNTTKSISIRSVFSKCGMINQINLISKAQNM